MRTLFLVIACLGAGCATAPDAPAGEDIHPAVFGLVDCWISDAQAPVATEISLDSVRLNGNQFDRDAVRADGEWTRIDAKSGFARYRVLRRRGNDFLVEYQSNGGGSLTTSVRIEFTLLTRRLEIDGKPHDTRVIRITGFDGRRRDGAGP